ncbi:IclR family transcriptional regulator [Halorarius litoreus]|uniref:IclR family transcriptional regulator n=1 Tax=Halorarius litoreus TaxID=2962676 RepID=UPI0020CCE2E3|nr:IclR family transcriptional regulator [Halorarius litoreus]
MGRERTTRTLKTTETTLEVIEALESLDGGRVSELAEELDMAASTVHAHLATLEKHEYVAREGDEYHLGLEFLSLGNYVGRRKPAYETAEAYTEKLASETECRAVFMVEEHGWGVYMFTASGAHAVWTYSTVGKKVPLHVTAAGKAILSKLPEQRVRGIIDRHGLKAETANSITDPEELFAELATIREQGYSFNSEEQLDGVRAVGVPVTDHHDRVIGSFSVASPANRLDDTAFEQDLPNTLLGIANEFELEHTLT